jgi:hypothetical protein
MRRLFIIPILFLMSCNQANQAVAIPKEVIDKEKFIEVLKDQALVEAILNTNVKNVDGSKFDSVYNFNVYKENNITKAQYDSTVKYYSAKPEEFKLIMESVLERLNVEKSKR